MKAHPGRPRTVVVIPCRCGSTCLPGKALAPLNRMPLMWHVHQQCLMAENINETAIAVGGSWSANWRAARIANRSPTLRSRS